MIGEIIPVKILALRLIANASEPLCRSLGLKGQHRTLGLISADCDDATYLALDEACKSANVEVVYARSLYAGASNASTRLAGEVIGILGGKTPSEVSAALRVAVSSLKALGFRTANEDGSIVYLAHCVSSSGSFLSKAANVPLGQPLAYLIAPPVEAVVGLDQALKAADVELAAFYAPPTETNFAGGLLCGTESACQAACQAFAEAVRAVAAAPKGEFE